ncbi:MAG: hydroxymethylbilane synthase [Phototrophicaceae bacterium]
MMTTIRFGTRGSALAMWQTHHAMALLQRAHPHLHVESIIISTRGDQILDTPLPLIGGKGLFTMELENALLEKRIDCAVHSLKDLPTAPHPALVLGAILERSNPFDALISREGYTLDTLPCGASIGTSSYRRAGQLLHQRPDLHIRDLRGNVDTRLRKALTVEGEYDAIVLACAGLERLGHVASITQILGIEEMLPAAGQGAIAIQTRDDPILLGLLAAVHHPHTALATLAERAFLAELDGGCAIPVGAYAWIEAQRLMLKGRVCSVNGNNRLDVSADAPVVDEVGAVTLGKMLAQDALKLGAKSLLE